MSNWLVAIVGGAIATVIGGVALFYLLPNGPFPSVMPAPNVVSAPLRHIECTMNGGVMDGSVYTFSLQPERKTGRWVTYQLDLNVHGVDEHRIHGDVELQMPGWPEHDSINFTFDRVTLEVMASLSRARSPEEAAKCRAQADGFWTKYCNADVVVEVAMGTCKEFTRAL